ncbi:molybdate ABC transporter substrate-binding protein [Colwellia ponticola]|nr:molybdate ABC transporter substrate-binding protein [Colwellia ponticola]
MIKQSGGASMSRAMLLTVFLLNVALNLVSVKNSYAQQLHNDNTKPLRIAVATNFTPILKILLEDFTKQTGINGQIISGASGAMFLQIQHGAPFDIFLSADSLRPQDLEQAGYITKGSRKTYAIGQLALYSSSTDISLNTKTLLEHLTNPPTRFAIANPKIAPYGKAAKEVLVHLDVWPRYQSQLIQGINIGQTFAQIRSKAVQMGIVANSQLVLNNLSGIVIPSSYHQPIEQQLVIVAASKQQAAAKKLTDFLLSPQSQKVIVSYGYSQVNANDKEVGNSDEQASTLAIK